jgi:hypothetical protein
MASWCSLFCADRIRADPAAGAENQGTETYAGRTEIIGKE